MESNIPSRINIFPLIVLLFSCTSQSDYTGIEDKPKAIAIENRSQKVGSASAANEASFAVSAAEAGLLEVELAAVTIQRSSSDEVKKFAVAMMTDYSVANSELTEIAKLTNIPLPTVLSADSRKMLNKIARNSGKAFDKAYCEFIVADHKRSIAAFRKQAQEGRVTELKNWASSKIGTLEHHLSMARMLDDNP